VSAECSPREGTIASPLACSRQLAALRVKEASSPFPVLVDNFASLLADEDCDPENACAAFDLLTTRYLDDSTLAASLQVNVGRGGLEYNQIVIVGDGYCTRAFRLPWPRGTVIYLVAPGEVHERAEALLAGQQIRTAPGVLLRRVDCNIVDGRSCGGALTRAGFRGDRLSVWCLQGIRCMTLSKEAMGVILADMSIFAAFESVSARTIIS
jgi:O-methyltransferase involved in polyketide biosynthesis